MTILRPLGLHELEIVGKLGPQAGTLVVAWCTTKLTEPLRLAGVLAVTPRLARMVGRKV